MGTWASQCVPDGEGSSRLKYSFDDTRYYLNETTYFGALCTTPFITVSERGLYVLGNTLAGAPEIQEIEMKRVREVWRTVDFGLAFEFHQRKECGIENWHGWVDTTGRTCSTRKVARGGTTRFDIISIEDNTLYFGNTDGSLNGRTIQTRPAHLFRENPYKKEPKT